MLHFRCPTSHALLALLPSEVGHALLPCPTFLEVGHAHVLLPCPTSSSEVGHEVGHHALLSS